VAIKRYVRRELIGTGGTASVYRGRDEALGREVAIKLYPPARDPIDAQRQEAEVNVLAGLSHHSLITLFDAGVDRGDPDNLRIYLVMELITGTDLQQSIAAGPITAEHIGQIGYDIAEGLQYIHHNGVVHRDVKPSNLLMVDYGDESTRARAKLTDFGIATYRGGASVAEVGVTTGTAAYLSPEQVMRGVVGPATDVYSLGLVLLECFTRTLAFPGTPVESALARLEHAPVIPDHVPAHWRDALTAMMQFNPVARPAASDLVVMMRDLVIADTLAAETR
jgi:serine/threonine protein kinase